MGVRHEWFQTEQYITVTIFAKGVTQDRLQIVIGKQNLSVIVKIDDHAEYTIDTILQHPIDPDTSSHKIFKTKVEIRLCKATGVRWDSLEHKEQTDANSGRAYPTSNRRDPVDWDRVEAEVEKQDAEEKKEGDAALNNLFQKIYADGNEDTRRAMIKSFQESGGTVLSTNWNDIGAKQVEVKPPDGMEYKSWSE
ncbi:protein SGT1 homolog [Bolinopsis microptera]|uniref:protein SGT1 homolog n=1 Tax=Bolinopsis microptera TaxID=2820187 RepID=UPI00307AC9E7